MAEEFIFEVIRETPYYYRDEYDNDLPKYAGMMQVGEEIKTDNSIGHKQIKNPPGTEVVVHFASTENANYFTFAENLVPKGSVSLLSNDVLTNGKFTWVPSYFLDVLRSKDRETVFDHESWVKKAIMAGTMIDVFSSSSGETKIYNSGIAIGFSNFLIIKNIEKTDVGYKIICMEPGYNWNISVESANWDLITGDGLIDLLFYIDGDYIDMYINNYDSSNKFFTIVRVNNEFIKQLCEMAFLGWSKTLLRNNVDKINKML